VSATVAGSTDRRRGPLGRFAEPEESADAVFLLAAPASDDVDCELGVDGGQVPTDFWTDRVDE
jgi:NAD(P)-dependent dehydrogenase (short-subunit alcohol dehydrogenase family)